MFETLDGHQDGPNGQIDGSVGWTNAVTLYGGQPHVWYSDGSNEDLRHAWWTGWTWMFETLDGHQTGPNGQIYGRVDIFGIAVTLYSGQPQIWYHDRDNDDLRHAWWNGWTWTFETLDGHQWGPTGQVNANVGTYSAATLYGGQPHVWYRDSDNGDLRHAWYG